MTVLVRDGTYVLKETLVFGPEDSGTPEGRFVYAAYPDEKPVLSGGREITGWKRSEGQRWVADVPAARGGAGASRSCSLTANARHPPACQIPTTGARGGEGRQARATRPFFGSPK